jgi:hypothetical protein
MKPTDQTVDDASTVKLGGTGQVGVSRGGGGAGMAEQRLDVAQA